jgi:hypothetical protein
LDIVQTSFKSRLPRWLMGRVRRWSHLPVLLVLAISLAAAAFAQSFKPAAQPALPMSPVQHVTLGQSAVPLYGPWKFTVGDSPIDPKRASRCGRSRGLTTRSGRRWT